MRSLEDIELPEGYTVEAATEEDLKSEDHSCDPPDDELVEIADYLTDDGGAF